MRLWLLRHAKSSWDDPGLPDIERPLAPRGARAAERIARYVRAEGVRPELVLCSPAARARGTLEIVLPSLGAPSVSVEPELYTFDPEPLVERIRQVPDDVASLMLVGHNPAMQALAVWLARGGDRLAELAAKYPTGALAELELDAATWTATAAGGAVLTRFVPPRELA
ncbi:MAG TPA: histidine phosphatase family protein [Actinomycetota bacterium]